MSETKEYIQDFDILGNFELTLHPGDGFKKELSETNERIEKIRSSLEACRQKEYQMLQKLIEVEEIYGSKELTQGRWDEILGGYTVLPIKTKSWLVEGIDEDFIAVKTVYEDGRESSTTFDIPEEIKGGEESFKDKLSKAIEKWKGEVEDPLFDA